MDAIAWLFEQIKWLVSLARPENLRELVEQIGPMWVYFVLSGIVFAETGLLFGFFLPGDSLLFAAGLLASQEILDILPLIALLCVAAVVGDAVNFFLGLQTGEHIFEKGRLRFIKHEHLLAAKAFYERHGGKAIVLARFMPIVRTFTPFVAGVARMSYRRFAIYNIAGGIGWVVSMTLAGFWLGGLPFVSKHFELVVIGIVLVSVSPMVIGVLNAWRKKRSAAAKEETA